MQDVSNENDVQPVAEPAVSDDSVSHWVILFGQGAAMAAIGFAGADAWPWPVYTWCLVVLGSIVAVAALPSLGKSFRVHPVPNGRGLKTTGVYSLTRNPMYLGLLLVALGICLDSRPGAWVFFAFLLLVLIAKIRSEEAELAKRYPEYGTYRSKVKRLIPMIW